MRESIEQKLKSCETLPSLPAVALHVLKLTENNDTDLSSLSQTIEKDGALAGKILRAVNSPFYGLGQKVSTLNQAVVLLGLQSVKTIVLSFSLVSMMKKQGRSGFNHLAYWRRSMYSATAARVMATKVLSNRIEDCFVAALLMDIGTLVLDQLLGDQYSEIYDRAASHADLSIVESHVLGTTHSQVSGILANQWKLPEMLSVPMAAHHDPLSVEDYMLKNVSQVVWLAGRCADVFSAEKNGAAESIASVRSTMKDLYRMSEMECDSLLCSIGRKSTELAHLFDVRLDESDYERILATSSDRLLELSLGDQAVKPAGDQRRATRVRRDGRIQVYPCSRGVLGQPIQMQLKDLSAAGIGVVSPCRMEKQAQIVIQINQKEGGQKTLLYTVARCEANGEEWNIGAELTSVLRPESSPAAASLTARTPPLTGAA